MDIEDYEKSLCRKLEELKSGQTDLIKEVQKLREEMVRLKSVQETCIIHEINDERKVRYGANYGKILNIIGWVLTILIQSGMAYKVMK